MLLSAARQGDVGAAKYLVDRALGRVQTQAKPLAEDYSLPATHPAAEEVATFRRRRELGKELACSASIREQVRGTEAVVTEAEVLAGLESPYPPDVLARLALPKDSRQSPRSVASITIGAATAIGT
jgi:hypothetical protein